MHFDVVVIGAGHAGCEAALAAARLGAKVALVTLRLDRIAQMSCNPAIGGVGKGHLVREIDALGGAMGFVADATGIQFRRLNASRGPAVQSTRCQSDSKKYREVMTELIAAVPNITLIEDEIVEILRGVGAVDKVPGTLSVLSAEAENHSATVRERKHRVVAVMGLKSGKISCDVAVVTAGTFLNGLCHRGEEQFAAGREGDAPATYLSNSLKECGIELGRFKTGTTPRLYADSIAWDSLEKQAGDLPAPRFSFDPVPNTLCQVTCAITHTTAATHEVIRANLHRSPLFQGVIKGLGPRYCPSIEDKVVRFADKERHQLFLEPEGLSSDWIYPNGLSTSLPRDVQDAFLHSIVGLENCRVAQYGYAVEYDFAQPTQLLPSLMTKALPGLFLAGQINGTSGYEEAAAQGLMAGVNAVRYLAHNAPVVWRRDQAYLGVLIDDLVTLGVDEPYRLFTSRAEHRLTLRETNAEARLWRVAAELGLLSPERRARAEAREAERVGLQQLLMKTPLGVHGAAALGLDPAVSAGLTAAQALKRPELDIQQVLAVLAGDATSLTPGASDRALWVESVVAPSAPSAPHGPPPAARGPRTAAVPGYGVALDATSLTPGASDRALWVESTNLGEPDRTATVRERPLGGDGVVVANAWGWDLVTCTFVEEEVKYEGYIAREAREIVRLQDLEGVSLPSVFDYRVLPGLSRELREKLTQVRPLTLGQASRIRGMTPAALALLRVHAKRSPSVGAKEG